MPQSDETRTQPKDAGSLQRERFRDFLTAMMKQDGFTATLKKLEKTQRLPGMRNVSNGVVEELPSGLFDASLQTDKGLLVLRGVEWADRGATDPQVVASSKGPSCDACADSSELTAGEILDHLTAAGAKASCSLVCQAELAHFDPIQREAVLPLLWQYVLCHRNSNDCDELVAVGAGIRKFVAIMPMDRMGELAKLLETGNRSPLPIDLEIEVAKMIYRNFEVHPPVPPDPHPELAGRLWEMVQAYVNPRILLRDKHSAAASLAIEAIVSLRSPLAEQACEAAIACPYRWFAELVSDDLDDLRGKWDNKNPDAATWLRELQTRFFSQV